MRKKPKKRVVLLERKKMDRIAVTDIVMINNFFQYNASNLTNCVNKLRSTSKHAFAKLMCIM